MRRIFKVAVMIVLSFLFACYIFGFISYAGIEFDDEKMDYSISIKGIKNSVAFDVNKDGEFIIAKKDKILYLKKDGKIETLYSDSQNNIIDMVLKDSIIYMVKGNTLFSFDIDTKKLKQLLNNIPIRGQENECKLLVNGENVLLSIGAVSNSGIIEDKQMAFGQEVYDRTPIDLYSTGKVFGKYNTGAFSPIGKSVSEGEKINGTLPANACILSIDKNNKIKVFASGIKNVIGFGITSDGNLIAAVSGMEEKGIRPISNDKDYIYEIKEGDWLGWPDFSGGDPVTSPRFRVNEEKVNFLLQNHMTENPKSPLYQHKDVNSISCMTLLNNDIYKDNVLFYDKKDSTLDILKNNRLPFKILKLNKRSKIVDLKNVNQSIYMLDGEKGVIYNIFNKSNANSNNSNILVYYFIGIILAGVIFIEGKKMNEKLSK
ncbi:hypothetical protein [Inconstantimicrobium mannanitabidum]|uniref:Uncharacterized protein n=1 Tax=Inconstantimicrobium mannanitabidum TaxID=1604901 RepID=A0ACB5RC90_9CLOT|nr:hypothetical protein [Clostridium sp. TW13]GKX66870.1 hypothetical protein rsdtw13_21280 [Clostridium sp. TW13]